MTLPDAALEELRALLGHDAVCHEDTALARYGRTTLASAPLPAAVLTPADRATLPGVLDIARRHRLSLYPVSGGQSWGFGNACPVGVGQVVLDLQRLDTIVEVNEELGYAVVEPGVSQGQLSRYLEERGLPWWIDCTSAPQRASVLGNILERGLSHGRCGDRFSHVSGMEVLLADGTALRTGFTHDPRSRSGRVYRWGIGPSLDGLFTQSNMGVVTELGVWLSPRPADAQLAVLQFEDDALEEIIDRLRPLRIEGVIDDNMHLYAPRDGTRWMGATGLFGDGGVVAARVKVLRRAVKGVGKVQLDRLALLTGVARLGRRLSATGLGRIGELLQRLVGTHGELLQGRPRSEQAFLEDISRGSGLMEGTTSLDPHEHGCGVYFLTPTCPMRGKDARELLELLRAGLGEAGIDGSMTINLVNGRALVFVVRVPFKQASAEATRAARACHRGLFEAVCAAGFTPYRAGIEDMAELPGAGDAYWDVVRRLKEALDPDGLLAPGRYGEPKEGRAGP